VKLAVGFTLPGTVAGFTVTLFVTVSAFPAASLTISLTGTVIAAAPAFVKVNDASCVVNSLVPSPVKSQAHPVTATLSVLGEAVKAHAVPEVQVGAVKFATGAWVSPPPVGGSSPPQADPSTRTVVATASKRIDRIESLPSLE
jgi:hypothetical protein